MQDKLDQEWQKTPADVLVNAYKRLYEYSIGEQTAIKKAMEERGLLLPQEAGSVKASPWEDRRQMLKPKMWPDSTLKELFGSLNPYQTIDDWQASVITEMKNRGWVSGEMTLEEYWHKAPENKLIESYRQLGNYDVISQEIIRAEIKIRRLAAKAATHNKLIGITKVDLVQFQYIPFVSMLFFAWKWAWAFFIVSIPFFIIWFLVGKIIASM